MEFIEAIVIGIIQGVTEWFPLSSEGMTSLVLINFFSKSISEAIPVSIGVHTGTMFAAILYFKGEIEKILRNFKTYLGDFQASTDLNYLTSFLIVSTFFTGIIGFPLFLFGLDNLDVSGKFATAIIGFLLVLTGVFQIYSKARLGQREVPTIADGILVGTVQAFSVFPGFSRSGLTISALIFRGYAAKHALRLSFIMGIPAVIVAELGLVLLEGIVWDINTGIAMVTSFVFGYITIKTVMDIAEKVNFGWFCIFLGLLSFVPVLV